MDVWYNWRVIIKAKFHSKFCNRLIEWKILIANVRRFSICVLNVNFRSIHIFSHLIIFWDFKIVSFDKIIELIDMIFFNSKWINSNFESSNCIAFASIHENVILLSRSVFFFYLFIKCMQSIWIMTLNIHKQILSH